MKNLNYLRALYKNGTTMKFSKEILIKLPREEVFNKLEDPAHFKDWQRGLISYRHLSGISGSEGSKSKYKIRIENREVSMIETIIKKVYPKKLFAEYESPGVHSTQKNYFEKSGDHHTLWITDSEFKFSGIMKLIGKIKPGLFKKQMATYMEDFKTFAEEGKSVTN